MVLSTRARATALASLVALSSVVNAQGFYYQDTRLQCSPQYNFQYLGCAETNTAPFAFSPNQWDPAITADLSRSSINYDIGDFVNMTGTPYFCSLFCRSHGFKFTALWDKSCRCGNTLNYNNLDGTAVNLQNTIDANSDDKCTNGRDGNRYPPCGGDRRENCGSNGGARIFVDPSFPDERALPGLSTLAQGYAVLECFKHARFPSGDNSITTVNTQSTETCFEYCADLGMPYVYMESTSTTGDIKCNCGTEFNKGTGQATIDREKCTIKCSNSTDTAACEGQDCCSTGNGPFPVYANPNLMGCFIPIIPGAENPDAEAPAPDGYNCFPTPQSILGRAPSAVVNYATRTMSASASFIATASPAANAFVNYGCWQSTQVANLFTTVFNYTLADDQLTVDKCVAFCDQANHNFAAVWGAPQTTCACGDALQDGVTPNGAMEDCNQPCTGSATQNCGGDNGPLVYAKSSITPNMWADRYTSSWSSTIVYSCTPVAGGGGGSGSGSATATPTSSANSTTPGSSTTPTSSPAGSSGSGGSTSGGGSTSSPSGSSSGSSSGSGSGTATPTGGQSGSSSGGATGTGSGSGTGTPTGGQSGSSSGGATGSGSGSSAPTGSGSATPTGGQSGSSSGGATGSGSGSSVPTSVPTGGGGTAAPTGGQSGSSSGGATGTGSGTATPTGGQSGSSSGGATGTGSGTATPTGGQSGSSSGGATGTGSGSSAPTGGNTGAPTSSQSSSSSSSATRSSSRTSTPTGSQSSSSSSSATRSNSGSVSVPTGGSTGAPTRGQSGSSSGGATGSGSISSPTGGGGTAAPTGSQPGSSSGSGSGSGSVPTGSGTAAPTGGQPGSASGGATGSGSGSGSVPTGGSTGSHSGSQWGWPSRHPGGSSRSHSSSVPTGSGFVTSTGGAPSGASGIPTAAPSDNGENAGTGSSNGNSGNDGAGGHGGNGGNGGDGHAFGAVPLPHQDFIFEEGHAPDDTPCWETTLGWVPGEPTFLPEHVQMYQDQANPQHVL
ncbi:hypothetical protein F5B21DRAFT_435046 [Xylaria acuta]|nr:hypothetical protein F5B21DRAFT_435046 [Xylaria acuta]